MNAYERKQEARRERLEAAADRARAEANGHFGTASRMFGAIPLGQPILVGHHSEGRDRRYRARASGHMNEAVAASKRADALVSRAASVGKGGISSDDPDAVCKLQEEFAAIKARQQRMVETNRLVRKGDRVGLASMGYSNRSIDMLLWPDELGQVGFPEYEIKNNGAKARRIEKRIAELHTKAEAPEREPIVGDGFRILEDRDINRCCIEFEEKPSVEVRAELKRGGFRWSPNRCAWVRQLSNGAWHAARHATRELGGES